MIELWGRKNAYNVQKVLWALYELELEFEHHQIGSNPGDLEKPEFLALNPHARIPVLVDGAGVHWESNSIVRYLGASHGAGKLWPQQAPARSQAERWMDWELTKLQEAFIDLFWRYYRTPPESHDPAAIEDARRHCVEHFHQLDLALSRQPYLGGDAFGIGDIACGVCLYRYFNMGLEVEQPAAVMQWYRRLGAREAYQRAVMLPFDELKGRVEF